MTLHGDLPPEVEAMKPDYSLYGIDYGLGYLMRGCIRRCTFCVVPEKEGNARQVSSIDDLLNPARPFIVLLDNEFFWKIGWAIERLTEFTERRIDFCPSQGLDIRCVTSALAAALAAAPYWNVRHTARQITFAFDDIRIERRYREGVETLLAAGIPAGRLQSFILVGFNSTLAEDLRRIAIVREYGIDPYVMVYRDWRTGKAHGDPRLRRLARWANRRYYSVCSFDDYQPEVRARARIPLAMDV